MSYNIIMMKFEWDENKSKKNRELRNLSFNSAKQVFKDKSKLTLIDKRKDYSEIRVVTIGQIRVLLLKVIIILVVSTDRNGKKRIISARKANKKERRVYYEHKE